MQPRSWMAIVLLCVGVYSRLSTLGHMRRQVAMVCPSATTLVRLSTVTTVFLANSMITARGPLSTEPVKKKGPH